MIYRVRHETIYHYDDPVQISHNLAHLRPRDGNRQTVLSFSLEVDPAPAVCSMRSDAWGNTSHFLLVQEAHRELKMVALSELEVEPAGWPDPESTHPWEDIARRMRPRPTGEDARVAQFAHPSPYIPRLGRCADLAREVFHSGTPVLVGCIALMGRIFRDFRYDPEATTVATPLGEVMERRRGVCQDFAHAMVGSLRALGLPARYVSGYLETRPPPGKARLVGADASHAWVQAWIPGVGWVDFDPTNDVMPSERHVVVAVGRDFGDVTPLKGLLLGGGGQKVSVSVDVEPLG